MHADMMHNAVSIDHERQFDHDAERTRHGDELFRCAEFGKEDVFELEHATVEKTDKDQCDGKTN